VPPAKRNADEALMAALACGATLENAAKTAGVSARTAHRRMRDPQFKQRLDAFRADMVHRTAGMVTAASTQAVKTLIALQDPSTPASVRLGAARALLEFGIKLRDSAEMEQRLARLEHLSTEGANNHAYWTPANPPAAAGEAPPTPAANPKPGTSTGPDRAA
jgi:hypothetical protein